MTEFSASPGDVIDDRYEVRRILGEGSEACVVEAMHLFTGQRVAIKIIAAPRYVILREERKLRLLREARALGRLRHAGIVRILDAGALPNGLPYLVMELLEGRSIEGLLAARGRFPVVEAVAMGLMVCDALGAAHAADIIHRDVKPANLVARREPSGREVVTLIDFGIAKLAESDATITDVGVPVGTPAYMAPEQLLGEAVDRRIDIYALGVTLFELISGQLPYDGPAPRIWRQVTSDAPAPSLRDTADVEPALARVVARAMAKPAAERYGSTEHFAEELRLACPLAVHSLQVLAPVAPAPRRKMPRAAYMTPIRLGLGDRTVDGRTEDISVGGLLVLSRDPLTPETDVTARFALPIEGRIVETPARVRWSIPREHGVRAAGLEFVNLDGPTRQDIARYVVLLTGQTGPEATLDSRTVGGC